MDLTAAGAAREVRPTCPVHDTPDCSSLLNGCSLPTQMIAYGQQLLDHVRANDEFERTDTVWRVEPLHERDSRPANSYDVVGSDGYPVTHALANLTHAEAAAIAQAHNAALQPASGAARDAALRLFNQTYHTAGDENGRAAAAADRDLVLDALGCAAQDGPGSPADPSL
ncbi:hypothetical protein CHO01_37020 [Cellulomonas hominis]|uniref:Uncharacterized protein n=1 Tax=Cellulomonas hominis TaxID=156981 RepID=A0A511FH58_9CELL|nr:hypothetical protein [Cellulomonas hominis]MBB5474712.1 hypothetical protein [Cellulomonas hominis]NKY06791.1 hypothetical protein [Cellulomonas hominis]GEL48586.1 hypothetical protein CHO01_37020 [Cellulomonas hominis]